MKYGAGLKAPEKYLGKTLGGSIVKILFQGDSLTDSGRSREEKRPNIYLGSGYVSMICGQLVGTKPGAGYEIFNRGINGNRIADMYARWIEDAVRPEYDLLSILCGVNDVGFSRRLNCGSDVQRFEFIYDLMLSEVVRSHPNARLILVEPFLFRFSHQDGLRGDDIYRDWEAWSGDIRERGEAAHRLARKYDALFIPMFDHFNALSEQYGPQTFSIDCIHLTPAGNYVLAQRWIEMAEARHFL